MCESGSRTRVALHVDASVAFEGRNVIKEMPIDSCIADLVLSLDLAGYRMLGSCCGHGEGDGVVAFVGGSESTVAKARQLLDHKPTPMEGRA